MMPVLLFVTSQERSSTNCILNLVKIIDFVLSVLIDAGGYNLLLTKLCHWP
jgi:hypothetical protein